LEENASERAIELEEILGYHLERAYRLRAELGPVDEHARALALRAAGILGSAGSRAFVRSDMPAAITLLSRALELGGERLPDRHVLLRGLSGAPWARGQRGPAEEAAGAAAGAAGGPGGQ